MRSTKSAARRRLDQRLAGLDERIGPRPLDGWIRAMREALGMSTSEMARRMGVSQTRISQLQRAEVDGSIRLSTLERAAEALSCRFQYVLIPIEPLEDMVRGQARAKAAAEVTDSTHNMRLEDQAPDADVIKEQIDALAEDLIDTRGLWRPENRSV
jgi:predicted DNA-binding mobile mystery protein A